MDGYLLLTSGLSWVQFWTRKPILFNTGQSDFMIYVMGGLSGAEPILEKIYGKQFHPEKYNTWSTTYSEDGRSLFETRTIGEWAELASEFSFSHILCPKNYQLSLPLAYEGEAYNLYRIVKEPDKNRRKVAP